jgi:hypothetical protein
MVGSNVGTSSTRSRERSPARTACTSNLVETKPDGDGNDWDSVVGDVERPHFS